MFIDEYYITKIMYGTIFPLCTHVDYQYTPISTSVNVSAEWKWCRLKVSPLSIPSTEGFPLLY